MEKKFAQRAKRVCLDSNFSRVLTFLHETSRTSLCAILEEETLRAKIREEKAPASCGSMISLRKDMETLPRQGASTVALRQIN